jgi:hypothetical protein
MKIIQRDIIRCIMIIKLHVLRGRFGRYSGCKANCFILRLAIKHLAARHQQSRSCSRCAKSTFARKQIALEMGQHPIDKAYDSKI